MSINQLLSINSLNLFANTLELDSSQNQLVFDISNQTFLNIAQDTASKTITFPITNGVNAIVQYQGSSQNVNSKFLINSVPITAGTGTSFTINNSYFTFSRINNVTTMNFNILFNNLVGFTIVDQTNLLINIALNSVLSFSDQIIYSSVINFNNGSNFTPSSVQSLSSSSVLAGNTFTLELILNAIPSISINFQLTGSIVFNATF